MPGYRQARQAAIARTGQIGRFRRRARDPACEPIGAKRIPEFIDIVLRKEEISAIIPAMTNSTPRSSAIDSEPLWASAMRCPSGRKFLIWILRNPLKSLDSDE